MAVCLAHKAKNRTLNYTQDICDLPGFGTAQQPSGSSSAPSASLGAGSRFGLPDKMKLQSGNPDRAARSAIFQRKPRSMSRSRSEDKNVRALIALNLGQTVTSQLVTTI